MLGYWQFQNLSSHICDTVIVVNCYLTQFCTIAAINVYPYITGTHISISDTWIWQRNYTCHSDKLTCPNSLLFHSRLTFYYVTWRYLGLLHFRSSRVRVGGNGKFSGLFWTQSFFPVEVLPLLDFVYSPHIFFADVLHPYFFRHHLTYFYFRFYSTLPSDHKWNSLLQLFTLTSFLTKSTNDK